MDFVGFGGSDKPEDFSYDLKAQSDIVIGLLNSLQVSQVHLIGHSRGGMTGTLLLKDAPNRIATLISLEGNLCYEDCGESSNVAKLEFPYFRKTYYPSLKDKLAGSKEPSAAFRLASLNIIPDYAFYRTSLTTVSTSQSNELLDIYRQSSHPKLMICGKNSSFHSRLQGENMELAEIPDSGHFMIVDNPSATISALTSFLSRHL